MYVVNNLPELNITTNDRGIFIESEYLCLKMYTSGKTEEQAIEQFKELMIDYYIVISNRGPKIDQEVITFERLEEYIQNS